MKRKILTKDTASQGLKWVGWQEEKFDRTPIAKINRFDFLHVQKLKKDFVRSLRFHNKVELDERVAAA